jgi:glycosyltransferase involved in cell wall biosynthesis
MVFTSRDSSNEITCSGADLPSAWREFGPDTKNPIEYTQRRVESDLFAANEALKAYRAGKIDLINSHDMRTNFFIFLAAKIPVLYTIHGDLASIFHAYDQYRYRELSKSSSGMTCISHDNEKFCQKNSIKNFGYTPNGVDTDKYNFQANSEKQGVIFVGRIVPEKKVEELILSVKESGQKLSIIGPRGSSPNEIKYFERLEKQYFGKDNVDYLGYKTPNELIPIYQNAKLIFMPTEREGMPMVLLEAMSSGVVPIASPIGGIKDVINNGENGILISSFGKNEIREALKKASFIKPSAPRDRIIKEFSLVKMAQNYLAAYNKFLG